MPTEPTAKSSTLGGFWKLRQYLNEAHRGLYDGYLDAALKATADVEQAKAIARERTLSAVMTASAAITATREASAANSVRDRPLPRR